MSVSTTNVTELKYDTEAGEWPITKTTVYNDQAEVRRTLTFKPTSAGVTLLSLKGLPDTINDASVRADVGSKNARLLEVFFDTRTEPGRTDEHIQKQIDELTVQSTKVNKLISRLVVAKAKITGHQESVLKMMNSDSLDNNVQTVLDPGLLPKISSALTRYAAMLAGTEAKTKEAREKSLQISSEMNNLRAKLAKIGQSKVIREASMLLELPEQLLKRDAKPVEVDLFYIVRGASWKASYDIRVEKGEEKAELTYYGEVINNTKENWVEVAMALSTARPSVGGALPPLPRKTVDFSYPGHAAWDNSNNNEVQNEKKMDSAMKSFAPQMMTQRNALFSQLAMAPMPNAPPPPIMAMAPVPPSVQAASVDSNGNAGSTVFRIQRLANIDSDNKPHRQTIALVSLSSLFTHAASPKVSKNVFMKLTTKNQSKYPFLPGQMSVFMDGSFNNNSSMELVRPNEEFAMFLGIDDSVKLGYSPEVVKKSTVGGGVMGGKKRFVKVVSREISVTNVSQNNINLCIYEQIPLSKEGKIKVELKKPDIKKPENGIRYDVNSFNNLETRTVVEPSKKFILEFEYSMEWPEGEEIEVIQRKVE